jgi:hypothetical protein
MNFVTALIGGLKKQNSFKASYVPAFTLAPA